MVEHVDEILRAKKLAVDIHGNENALSKLISLAENCPDCVDEIMPIIPTLGKARTIGFTGPPGAGKSTLIDQVISALRERDRKIGVIAIDPTSPFSRGALLGDRIRMQQHSQTTGVFIRSMATRGNQGGLAKSTQNVIRLMDAFGMDDILVETVGVGQMEIDVMETTELTVVILVPEGGDSIQAMKGGLMEIGDIFVINKSDRPNAERMAQELSTIFEMSPRYYRNMPPILLTQATTGSGISELVDALQELHRHKLENGDIEAHHRKRRMREFKALLCDNILKEFETITRDSEAVRELVTQLVDGKKTPHLVMAELFPDHILAR